MTKAIMRIIKNMRQVIDFIIDMHASAPLHISPILIKIDALNKHRKTQGHAKLSTSANRWFNFTSLHV